MPIFDQGYQHWQGRLSGHTWRWLTITRQGVRNQQKSIVVRVAVLVALLPALALAGFLVFWGLFEQKSSVIRPLLFLLDGIPQEIRAGPEAFRLTIWTYAYQMFFQFQLFFTMLVVLLVGPNLISRDLRFNAMPLYFSKPLRRFDYFAGKLGVIGVYVGIVVVMPAVLAYVLGLAFSLKLSVVKDTFGLLLASIGFGLVVVLSAGSLVLALSSLSRNSRYVGALWLGLCLVSSIVGNIVVQTVRQDWCRLLSYPQNLSLVCDKMLDVKTADKQMEEVYAKMQARMMMPAPMAPAPRMKIADPKRRPVEKAAPVVRPAPPPELPPWMRPIPETPWYWSAGVLTALFGLSLCTLSFRVKSLDRLR
jgi:ABC-2 type transport system permease protein